MNSEDMSPSWKLLANVASRSVKNFAQRTRSNSSVPAATNRDLLAEGGDPSFSSSSSISAQPKLTWAQWAGQKFRRNGQFDDGSNDRVSLFPGWATRRYHQPPQDGVIPPGEYPCK